ncbi:CLUMA_CG015959, isoform A [Clunio marinus]|uniref:CLUMA_CG015959, isoform A n=1 Tax=Clunio marinus TaxID=568069 RepID=A0A1J1IR04_9DIPT|nr:CLUMA_CG015959, isoform A [Clunio marinus]
MFEKFHQLNKTFLLLIVVIQNVKLNEAEKIQLLEASHNTYSSLEKHEEQKNNSNKDLMNIQVGKETRASTTYNKSRRLLTKKTWHIPRQKV